MRHTRVVFDVNMNLGVADSYLALKHWLSDQLKKDLVFKLEAGSDRLANTSEEPADPAPSLR